MWKNTSSGICSLKGKPLISPKDKRITIFYQVCHHFKLLYYHIYFLEMKFNIDQGKHLHKVICLKLNKISTKSITKFYSLLFFLLFLLLKYMYYLNLNVWYNKYPYSSILFLHIKSCTFLCFSLEPNPNSSRCPWESVAA